MRHATLVGNGLGTCEQTLDEAPKVLRIHSSDIEYHAEIDRCDDAVEYVLYGDSSAVKWSQEDLLDFEPAAPDMFKSSTIVVSSARCDHRLDVAEASWRTRALRGVFCVGQKPFLLSPG